MGPTKRERQAIAAENRRWPNKLILVQGIDLDLYQADSNRVEVWRSRHFLVQVFALGNGFERLSVNRTRLKGGGWDDCIEWEELQRLKSECGRGDRCAVEVFPPDDEVINVANMRHLFILPEPPDFMWSRRKNRG